MGERRRPRVFISYAHDSDEHKNLVLRLGNLLRGHGVDAWLDSYDGDERRDWYAWMTDQIKGSDYVLVVASAGYRASGDGNAPANRNRGVQAEAALLRELLHTDRPTWTRKLLPVILPGGSADQIPLFLQPWCADHYPILELSAPGMDGLLRTITRQPAHPAPELGDLPDLPPHPVPGDDLPRTATVTMQAKSTGSGDIYQAGGDQYITDRKKK